MCLRLEPSGDWWPDSEPAALVAARRDLLQVLARSRRALPGDRWLLGQEVAYGVEAGEREAALRSARDCGVHDPAWCAALEGYVLHTMSRFLEAEGAFRRALALSDDDRRRRWTDPRDLLDRAGREVLDRASPDARRSLVDRFWEMADPFFLVEGNDRWTEHLARHVLVEIREDADNPYGLRWGDDLAETLLRYGWEVGWERVEPRVGELAASAHAVGHQHPESRSHLPPGAALLRLGETSPEDWNPGSRILPRTGYAPGYAPVVLPAEGELLRFPRGDSLVLVSVLALPQDTTYHRLHGHEPLPVPATFRGRPGRVGLFAQQGGAVVASDVAPLVPGVARIAVPPGEYLLSAEVWVPDSARAGRFREGTAWRGVPPDVPTLSHLLLAEVGGPAPRALEELLPRLRRAVVAPGERIRVGWEIHGFGWRPETLRYRLELVEASDGLIRSLGRLLGLRRAGRVLSLRWEEPGPEETGPYLRTTELALPADLEPGEYLLRLRVEAPGREALISERALELLSPSR